MRFLANCVCWCYIFSTNKLEYTMPKKGNTGSFKLSEKGKKIKEMLLEGKSSKYIMQALNTKSSNVSFHARKLGLGVGRNSYDWKEVQKSIDNGLRQKQLCELYGFNPSTYSKAVARGSIKVIKKYKDMSFEEIAKFTNGKCLTGHQAKLIRNHLSKAFGWKCSVCLITEWNGKSIIMEVDHIDGNRSNNLIENLRLLCPNCHSQTSTWRGKNFENLKNLQNNGLLIPKRRKSK